MEYIISQAQFDTYLKNISKSEYEPCGRGGNSQIHLEDIIFFEKFFEKYGFLPFPKEMERLGGSVKIGDVYPKHPMSHLTAKSYYICKSKIFKNLREIVSHKMGVLLSDSKVGGKRYITNDKKYQLRSVFEVIFYNIFLLNGVDDKLEVDSRKFFNRCGNIQKEVDFIYENKIVIEIAGMWDDEYFNKIESSMKCIKSLGYITKIYKTRHLVKSTSYIEFYLQICNDFNFPINDDVLDNPTLLIGHENLKIEDMVKFVEDNIKDVTQNTDPKKYYKLRMYIKKLYGKSVNEYRKEKGIKQKNR